MYKEYTQLEYMKLMMALVPNILIRSQKSITVGYNPNKRKMEWKNKREDVCIWTAPEVLHTQIKRILANHFPGIPV